jgi:hypothetical protein
MLGILTIPSNNQGNRNSAEAYISASLRLMKAITLRMSASEDAAKHVLAYVKERCPNTLKAAPNDKALALFEGEVEGIVAAAMKRPNTAIERSYVAIITSLRWTTAKVGHLIADEARDIHAELTLSEPGICTNAIAWKATNFTVAPAATKRFAVRIDGLSRIRSPSESIRQSIASMVSLSSKRLLRRVALMEARLDRELTMLWLSTVDEVNTALGITPNR